MGPTGTTEAPATGSGLFERKASGLVREIGLRDAFTLNLSVLNLAGPVIVIISALALFPGLDMTWPIVVAGAISLPLALIYSQLAAAMPRSGGDYIFVGRLLHPALGAAVGFALLISIAYNFGASATQPGFTYFPFLFTALGSAFDSQTLSDWAPHLATDSGALWSSLVMLLGVMAVAMFSVRLLTRLMFIFMCIGALGILVLIFQLLAHDPSSFREAFNSSGNGHDAYAGIIEAARREEVALGSHFSAALSSLPFAALLYFGYTYTVYPVGEVKNAGKTVLRSTLLCLVVGGAVVLLTWLAAKHLAGLEFLQASSHLAINNPEAAEAISPNTLTIQNFALLVMDDPVSKILVGVSLYCWGIVLQLAGILVVSRIVFALAFDRLLPRASAYVNPRRHTPMVAVVISGSLAILFMILTIYTGISTAFRNMIICTTAIYTLVSLAAVVLPYVKPQLLQASPKPIGRGRILGLPRVTAIGLVSLVVEGALCYLAASKPQISGGYDRTSIILLLTVGLSGFIVYAVSRLYLRSRGTDLSLAMRELPPE
jgi:APA family basic amino acid/polyamine antiporter